MVGATVVLIFFLDAPWLSCPVLVTEIRCRTDGYKIQFSLASNNHIHDDLISVLPYTSTSKYFQCFLTK